MEALNYLTLSVLAYIDYRMYKIPNVILCGWLLTYFLIGNAYRTNSLEEFFVPPLLVSILLIIVYVSLNGVIKISAGDVKLYNVLLIIYGVDISLFILLIAHFVACVPLGLGVKKVPMALMVYFGYIAFLLFWKR